MTGRDALGDEMDFLRNPTPEDADLAAFATALRETLVVEPDRASSEALVRTLAETARVAAVTAPTTERRAPQRAHSRWGRFARVALVTASIPLLFAGLAFAGVKLPVVDDAFESVGIELPNQATDDDTEGTAKDGDSAGSATGQENSSGKLGHGKAKAKNGKAKGHAKNGKALGKQGLAPGQTKESGKPDAAGSDSSNAGGSGGGSSNAQGKGSSSSGGGSSNAGGNGGGPKK